MGVGIVIKESILQDIEKDELAVEYTRTRLMQVRLNLKGKSNGASFVVAYAPTDNHKSLRDRDHLWATLGSTVVKVPEGEALS